MPPLVRLYARQCLLGLALGIVFTVALVVLNVGGLGHLVEKVEGGWLAFAALCLLNGTVFAGAQFAITILGMTDDDENR